MIRGFLVAVVLGLLLGHVSASAMDPGLRKSKEPESGPTSSGKAKSNPRGKPGHPRPNEPESVFAPLNGDTDSPAVFIPANYAKEQRKKEFPLILYLHGKGQNGQGGNPKPEDVPGLGTYVAKQRETFPFIVLFPRGRHDGFWFKGGKMLDAEQALARLEEAQKKYRIDPRRIYLTGVSMGGHGVWEWAAADPQRWAAIVPVSGGAGGTSDGPEAFAKRVAPLIQDIPCWCVHGTLDKTRFMWTEDMYQQLKELHHPPIFLHPKANHPGTWPIAYGDKPESDELYQWLLKHSR